MEWNGEMESLEQTECWLNPKEQTPCKWYCVTADINARDITHGQ
uniref:Uncharacterized protein n=1 Tax=Anguilla anguilla TaxID=7936 RepID=A0A0E9RXZ9_ANGAN